MLISKKGYYYIKVILFFAFGKKGSYSIKEVSERLDISDKVLEQVLLSLKKADLMSSKRGPGGGYTLLEEAKDMSIIDILERTNEDLDVLPTSKGGEENPIDKVLSDVMGDIRRDIIDLMRCCTISMLKEKVNKEIIEKDFNYII